MPDPIPTSEQFIQALRELNITPNQRAMLAAHYRARDQTITMAALARAVGYSGHHAANLHYGKLAGKLADILGYNFNGQIQMGLLGTFNNDKNPDEPWLVTMHPQLAEALEKLGWTEVESRPAPAVQSFEAAFLDFVQNYGALPIGQTHLQRYEDERRIGLENYRQVLDADQRGEDITDLVLARLLPHHDTSYNRERGAWINQVKAITRDIKPWFENGKWKTPDEWPGTARLILDLLKTCDQDHQNLQEACQTFADNPLSNGFQTGLLTPILNAIAPDHFRIWNEKARRLFTNIQGGKLGVRLSDYPEANRLLGEWLEAEQETFERHLPGVRPADAFDCMAHYAALKKPAKREPVAWKVAPGEQAWQWEECLQGGFIAIGWDEFEDVSDLSREEFDQRRDELISAGQLKSSETGSEQLWSFLHDVQEGDVVVTNRGRSTVLGIGRVTGPYRYEPEGRHRHRRSVRWEDTRARALPPQPWLRTLIRLKPEELETILQAGSSLPRELASLFESEEEVRWAFTLIGRALGLLGARDEDDPRVALTSPQTTVLRLNFGNWPVLEFEQGQLRVALLRDQEAPEALLEQPPFAQPDGRVEIGMVVFSRSSFNPPAPALEALFTRSMQRIGELFSDYQGSPWRPENRPELLDAALDPKALDALLRGEPPPEPAAGFTGYLEPDFQAILQAVRQEGMRLSDSLLRRYHLGLKTRGFVILSGVSGSGKTWLAEAYARAVGARRQVVPVAPNWTTNEDLLGYRSPLDGQYHDTPFSLFLREASAEAERAAHSGENPVPFHLILDEMNLARVEYYFARFLSQMEIRARSGEGVIELGPDDRVTLGKNLFVIGTVNIDETTHGFADKVYDRAQLIEMEVTRQHLEEELRGASFGEPLLEVWDCVRSVAPFGYRVVREFTAYVNHGQNLGLSVQEAVDEQLLQKVLPKFRGSDPRTVEALSRLRALAEAQQWKLSLTKLDEMLDCHERHGLVSFFLL